jgi:hypothetical protein
LPPASQRRKTWVALALPLEVLLLFSNLEFEPWGDGWMIHRFVLNGTIRPDVLYFCFHLRTGHRAGRAHGPFPQAIVD